MDRILPSDPLARSADPVAANLDNLRRLFPEAFTEGRIDFAVLRQLLGGAVDESTEKYGLHWHGKRDARRLALTPSAGTLRPGTAKESRDWDTTQNLMIEGDNLEVLKLLQKSYTGKVKLIYIDPPYNTGNDFVYPDDFKDGVQNYKEITGQTKDGVPETSKSNSEASGRFHTDWLNMMYPRLKVARDLLADDGVIFISIDDGEVANISSLLNEVFGEENFQSCISWQKRYTRSNNTTDFTTMVEHIVVYSRSKDFVVNLLERTDEADARYTNPDNDLRGPWKGASFLNPATPEQRPNLCYPITNPNTGTVTNPTTNAWRRSKDEFANLLADGKLYWGRDGTSAIPSIKMFLSEARCITPVNFWDHEFAGNTDDGTRELKELLESKVFDNPKPPLLIQRVLEHGANKDSLILDFFAGSGTTGHAVMAQNAADGGNRKYILVQLPEPTRTQKENGLYETSPAWLAGYPTIAEITKARLRRAADKIRTEWEARRQAEAGKTQGAAGDLDLGDSPAPAAPATLPDLGFRVYKLDSSNLREWDPDEKTLGDSLLEHAAGRVKPGRTAEDLLAEIQLKFGLPLTGAELRRTLAGHTCSAFARGTHFVCLSETITPADAETLATGLAAWRASLAPDGQSTAIFRDDAFADDIVKTNLTEQLRLAGITSVRSL